MRKLADNANAARLLDEIERLGLFVDVLDAPVRTLRLHDLFREALQRRLQLDRPDDWRALMQRAAALEGDTLRKQAMLLAASCFEEAARALLADGTELNISGAAPTTLRLVDAFPPDFIAGNAELQRVLGIGKISVWRFQEAERHFVQAEALYAARGDTGAVQSMTARRGQAMIALGRLQECAAIVEALQRVPLIEVEARLIAATVTMWLHLERGESRAVAPAFEKLVQLLQSCTTVGEWNIIPPPRQIACPGMAGPMLRWGTGALAVTGDRPHFPLRAMAQVAVAWRALWLGQLQEAADLLAAAVADAQWAGHEVILRSHSIALRAMLALLRGDNAEALQCARTRIDEHPAGYGDWGLWHVLYFSARIAAAAGDAPALRDWLQRLLALQAKLTEADPQRLRAVAGLQGAMAELEGRRDEALAHWRDVLAHEEAADLVAQAGEVRMRLASIALKNGAREEAAALIRPLLQSARRWAARRGIRCGGIGRARARGLVGLLGCRRVGNAARMGGVTGAHARERRTGRCAGRGSVSRRSNCRAVDAARDRSTGAHRRRRQQQADRARVRPESAHRQAPRRAHSRQARPRFARPGGGLVSLALRGRFRLRKSLTLSDRSSMFVLGCGM